MIAVGHFTHVICSDGDGGDLAEIHNLRLVDAGRREKSEKKARIRGGRGSKEGTWKIDYSAVGHDISWFCVSPSHVYFFSIILKQKSWSKQSRIIWYFHWE
jgi:hypothetical protein